MADKDQGRNRTARPYATASGARVVNSTPPNAGIIRRNVSGPGMRRMADSRVIRVAPRVYSPMFELSNLMLPRDQKTLNAWQRHFYECYDEETETLTDSGFKYHWQITSKDKIAVFNPESENIEYHYPENKAVYDYDSDEDGPMIRFQGTHVDIKVTQNHRMWVQNKASKKWNIEEAHDVKQHYKQLRFRSVFDFEGVIPSPIVFIGEHEIGIEDYLELLGYYISEGSTSYGGYQHNNVKAYGAVLYQNEYRKQVKSTTFDLMTTLAERLPFNVSYGYDTDGWKHGNNNGERKGIKSIRLNGQDIIAHLHKQCGKVSGVKKIPHEIKQYSSYYLKILLDALMVGDGFISSGNDYGRLGKNDYKQFVYHTTSKRLASDVQEIVQKLGYSTILRKEDKWHKTPLYYIRWSETSKGDFPSIRSDSKKHKGQEVLFEDYKGKVYCFSVPPHRLFVTRRNGNVTVQGNTNPIVRNSINLHSTYPISKMQLHCKDPKVLQFFEDMNEEIELQSVIAGVALEFWKLGEVFPHAELDENTGVWSQIIIHNPDYIAVKANILAKDPIISLQPDDTLRRIVMSTRSQDTRLRQQLPPEIIYYIQRGENIPLSNFNVSHLKLPSSPYDIRGTSIIACVFKDLMLYDKLREAKFAQADNLVNPITLVKLGDPKGHWKPSDSDIQQFQQVMEEAQYDPDFKIITHGAVEIERIGAAGSIIDIQSDIDLIIKNILTGLFTPEAVVTGEGPNYSTATVGLEVLQQRYLWFREFLKNWLRKKIFAPISQIQEFYEKIGGEKKLIVPEVDFDKINLKEVSDYIASLTALSGMEGPVSDKSLLRSLDLDYDEEAQNKRKEIIDKVLLAKEAVELEKYSLDELRALDPKDPIKPKATEALPGEVKEEEELGLPGGEESPGIGLGMPEVPLPGGSEEEVSSDEMGVPLV